MTKRNTTPQATTVKPTGVLQDLDAEAAAEIKGGKKKEPLNGLKEALEDLEDVQSKEQFEIQ